MNKEKLIIRNFGPIKEVELDLGRFTILIGEQATGKSTVAKVLAVCRNFSYVLPTHISDFFQDGSFLRGLKDWGLEEAIKDNSYFYYSCSDYSFSVEKGKILLDSYTSEEEDEYGEPIVEERQVEEIVFSPQLEPRSEQFKRLLIEFDKIKPTGKKPTFSVPTSFYLNDVAPVMESPFYLPTQRGLQSIFDIGQSSIKNLSSALFNQLSEMDGIARMFKKETLIEPLDIYYVNRDGHGFIRKANETEFYSLYNAASGYQSMIPIALVVKYYVDIRKKSRTFLVEEAEQNLFPSAQNKLMQYLVDKIMNHGNSILLTTQSPYILASVNNSIYAHNVGANNKAAVNEVIKEKYWLDPEEVSAYRMLSDGTARNIIDSDLKEIKVEEIDEVSKDVINRDYDRILDIKFGVNDAA